MSAHLAEDNLPLAGWVVHSMTRHMPPLGEAVLDDLVSCATIALVEVAGRYNPDSRWAFSTYAVTRMRGAVLDELRRIDWASRSVRGGGHRLAAADAALSMELGREPTSDEIAARMGLTGDELARLRHDVHRALVVHLDGIVNEDGEAIDLPARAPGPEDEAISREEHDHVRACVAALPQQYRQVVERNFFGDDSLTAIAADLGLTLSRVSQIRARALLLLHAALARVWELDSPAPVGGIRARNEEQEYVSRAAVFCATPAGLVAA